MPPLPVSQLSATRKSVSGKIKYVSSHVIEKARAVRLFENEG